jgi:hypothetical protein
MGIKKKAIAASMATVARQERSAALGRATIVPSSGASQQRVIGDVRNAQIPRCANSATALGNLKAAAARNRGCRVTVKIG